jgi:hypothetical protein
LIATNAIHVMADINASGEGGRTGAQNASGGGGGGSGGMIVLDAPVVTSSGVLLANGGGGGEGSSDDASGSDGMDPATISAAVGGTGLSSGGDGGNGSAGIAGGGAANGANGTIVFNREFSTLAEVVAVVAARGSSWCPAASHSEAWPRQT